MNEQRIPSIDSVNQRIKELEAEGLVYRKRLEDLKINEANLEKNVELGVDSIVIVAGMIIMVVWQILSRG